MTPPVDRGVPHVFRGPPTSTRSTAAPPDVRRVIDLGVDGVISNRPDAVQRALADRLVPA
jgi:glycerophosphoryl diester phosphodiesterase